jgi:hypothetical protein
MGMPQLSHRWFASLILLPLIPLILSEPYWLSLMSRGKLPHREHRVRTV